MHVAGAVKRPGLYTLPEGSRVAAAIERAGGPTRKARGRARSTSPRRSRTASRSWCRDAGPGGAGPGAAAGQGPPSLSTATTEQLDELDGIGPTLAERIVEFREKNGGFRSVEQLREVEGIGEKRFEALKEALTP